MVYLTAPSIFALVGIIGLFQEIARPGRSHQQASYLIKSPYFSNYLLTLIVLQKPILIGDRKKI